MELRTNQICNTARKWLFEEQSLEKDRSQGLHLTHPDWLFLVISSYHIAQTISLLGSIAG